MSDIYVKVLYDFQYSSEDGNEIKIKAGEELLLLKKSNENWWQVIRSSDGNPFYAPSSYLTVIGLKCKETSESVDVNSNITGDNKQTDYIKKVKPKFSQVFKRAVEEIKLKNADLSHKPIKDGLAFKNPLCSEEFTSNSNDKERLNRVPSKDELMKSTEFFNPKDSDNSFIQVNIFKYIQHYCIYSHYLCYCICFILLAFEEIFKEEKNHAIFISSI